MNSWMLYAIDVVGGLQNLLTGISLATAAGSIIIGSMYAIHVCTGEGDEVKPLFPVLRMLLIFFGIFALLAVLVPSRSSLLLMYTAQYFSGEEVKKLPGNVVKALNTYLEDMVKDKERSK